MSSERNRDGDDNQNQTDVLVFGRVSDAQAVGSTLLWKVG